MWKSNRLVPCATLMIAAVLTTACSQIPNVPPEARAPDVPEACALVSEETVAALVGPALGALTAGVGSYNSRCEWGLIVSTSSPRSEIGQPYERQLVVEISTPWVPRGPCDPAAFLTDPRPIDGVGERAAIETPTGTSEISYCTGIWQVSISLRNADRDRTTNRELAPDQAEAMLLRIARETEGRLPEAPRHQPTTIPKVVLIPPGSPCNLITATTVAEFGHPMPPKEDAPLDLDYRGSYTRTCHWLPVRTEGARRADEITISVEVTRFVDQGGHTGAAWADLYARQWVAATAAQELPGLGTRAGIVTDGTAEVVAAQGSSAVRIYFSKVTLTDAELSDVAERLAREALEILGG